MIKFKIEDLREVSVDELLKIIGWDISDCFEKIESGVYKIEFGSRGEIEEIELVEVKNGCFEVMSREELLDSCKDEEEREEMEDWCYVELDSGVVNCCVFEEYGFDYYRVRG